MTRPRLVLWVCLGVTFAVAGRAAAETGESRLDAGSFTVDADLSAREHWTFDPEQLTVTHDGAADVPALTPADLGEPHRMHAAIALVARESMEAPVVIEARLRLPTDTAAFERGQFSRAELTLGWRAEPSEGDGGPIDHALTLDRARYRDRHGYRAATRVAGERSVMRRIEPVYTFENISPLLDPSVRGILERRADEVPVAHARVHRLRIEVRETAARFYANGRFIDEVAIASDKGRPYLELRGHVNLLGVTAHRPQDVPSRFVPVPLDDLFNDVSPDPAAALPVDAGRVGTVHGIPFVRSVGAEDENNLDLEPSVYMHRMGSMRDGDPREAVHAPEMMDISRFTLRVPQRTWRRAWVLAASDDDPHHVPLLTLRFYVPRTAWTLDAEATVPTYEARSVPGEARRVAIADGRSLWLVPIEIDAARLAAEPMTAVELTKQIYPYRGYPDPAYYNSYPGGLPSAVHVYGLTLEEAPVRARGTGSMNGNLYVHGDRPTWHVHLENLTNQPQNVDIALDVTGPYGKRTQHERQVTLPVDGEPTREVFMPPTDVHGLHAVRTTITVDDFTQSREGTFLKLPPNDARADASNSPWGLWCWNGTHDTNPDILHNMRLLRALGAINNYKLSERIYRERRTVSLYEQRRTGGVGPMHHRLIHRRMPEWAMQTPDDKEAFEAYAEEKGKEAARMLVEHPDLEYVNFFAENYLSLRLSHGMPPWAMGEPWWDLTEREQQRLTAHWVAAKAALKGVREHAPQLKVLFGHCPANFFGPFFREPDWDNEMFEGFGLDLPQFERMPERQPRATEPSLLYFLHHQMEEHGIEDKELVHLESYFPSTGPLALSPREQADSVVRTAMLSMALGTTRFMRTWELHTSGDGWGASHYGSAGVIGRASEYNPKPAAAAFATMARVVDLAKYDGYLDLGSRSAFCLRFRDRDRRVYVPWTVRGTRPLQLEFESGSDAVRIDMHGNRFPVELDNGKARIELSPTPQWIVVRDGAIARATVGEPTYTAAPAELSRVVDALDGDWTYTDTDYPRYENNHWDMPRAKGKFDHAFVDSEQRGSKVLRVAMRNPDHDKPMVGFYAVFEPPQPIELSGKPEALGLWVNGASGWNRFIYEITDANGEVWLSVGTKDAWNCDDIHSWSSINHDGWRYMRFPLPGSAPGDNFREADTVWWGSDAEGVVDLPVRVTRLMVEMRPRMVYVNDMLELPDYAIELDDLTVEYASERAMSDEPVNVQRAAAGMLEREAPLPLPQVYERLQREGDAPAPEIATVYPPDQFNNGRRLYVEVEPVEQAERYLGYVSAYPDGRGAKRVGIDAKSSHRHAQRFLQDTPNRIWFNGLVPDRPMYLFVTCLDADGNESRPSPIREVVLKDEFPFE